MYAMSVCSRVSSSTVVDPESKGMSPGISFAPVSVTLAERTLTSDGGVSVIARTTLEFPLFWVCEPNWFVLPQPASAEQRISPEIVQID